MGLCFQLRGRDEIQPGRERVSTPESGADEGAGEGVCEAGGESVRGVWDGDGI